MINVALNLKTKTLENAITKALNKKIKSRVIQKAKDSIRDSVRYIGNTVIAEEVAKYAPDRITERKFLNEGVSNQSMLLGGEPITSSRFMKEPEFMYLKEAISTLAEFDFKSSETENLYNIEFSLSPISRDNINDAIGFAWLRNMGGMSLQRRSTLDNEAGAAWSHLLEMWEDGGSFTVKPRDPGGRLNPGPGLRTYALTMRKTIKPQQMFDRGMKKARTKMIKQIKENLKKRFAK